MIEKSNSKHKDYYPTIPTAKNETIYVCLNDQKEATFICDKCGNGVTRDLSKVLHAQTAIRVKCKCKCGHVFRVLVERRCNKRKSVNLLGMCHYLTRSGDTKKRLIKIIDISYTGLHVSISSSPEFKVGNKVIVEFGLDDREKTKMKVKATVKRILSKSVGLEFIAIDDPNKLYFYLMR
jgi:tRNA(Glu) U13 pseudouridine synthase TruD